jgi:hypothetical protein
MEGFEVFEKYHSRSVKELYVTIQKRGTISLNRASYRAMGSPKYAELLFNRSKRLIGIRPANTASGRTVPVRRQGHSESYLIAGLTFTKEYDIDSSVARRFVATLDGNMLVIDLNSPSTDATGPRARSDDSEATQEDLFSQSGQDTESQEAVSQQRAGAQKHAAIEPEMTATINKGIDDVDALANALSGLGEEQKRALSELWLRGKEQGEK